jgi:hypothetical protein
MCAAHLTYKKYDGVKKAVEILLFVKQRFV